MPAYTARPSVYDLIQACSASRQERRFGGAGVSGGEGGGPRSASETASFARAFSTSSSSTARGARATAARRSPETCDSDAVSVIG